MTVTQTLPMEYTEVDLKSSPEKAEILVALLSEAGYEMFEEYEGGLKAYLPTRSFNRKELEELLQKRDIFSGISFTVNPIEDKNWNEEWEKNYPPVFIANRVYIRTSFHPSRKNAEYEILIDPKMSFGTGHHDTTSLMIKQMLETEFEGRKVLDMGCGTAILAIFASMRGADSVDAIDIDTWACTNGMENCKVNRVSNVTVIQGDASVIPSQAYDILLANINRNIILQDLERYSSHLLRGGHLLLSGFLREDEVIIKEHAARFHLKLTATGHAGSWSCLHFQKLSNA